MEKRKAKIIMLPTEDKSNIYLHNQLKKLNYINEEIAEINLHNSLEDYHIIAVETYTPQNLYITTDDEIEEGDWYYDKVLNKIYQLKAICPHDICDYLTNQLNEFRTDSNNAKKIIATTDKSLFYTKHNTLKHSVYEQDVLPQPSQAFIEKYCKVGGIDEVLVEYEDNSTCKTTGICKQYSSNTDKVCIGYCKYSQLRVDSHNTITIHPIKNSWTREEIKELCNLYESIIHGDFYVMTRENMVKRIKELKQ